MQSFILTLLFRWLKRYAPYSKRGDHFRALSDFFRAHGRLPTDRMLLNDYLYRLKLSDDLKSPERRLTSDKELTKLYVAAEVGEEYNVPTIAVLKTAEEIRRFNFPSACVIKTTHASARKIFRYNGEDLNIDKIAEWLKVDFYKISRENNYRYLIPKIIVEPFLFEKKPAEDVKVFCYMGEPKVIRCSFEKTGEDTRKFFSVPDWTDLKVSMGYPVASQAMPKPRRLDDILRISRILARRFEFVRVDFFAKDDELYVGELTHVHGAANERFHPPEAETLISDIIFGETPRP